MLRHAEVAQQAARNAGDLATMRLRVGYLPDSLPASVPRALRRLAGSAPRRRRPHDRPSLRLIDEVRERRLDAVITSLPAPTTGLRVTPGEQRAVAVLPATHSHAVTSAIALERLAPDRLIMLPERPTPDSATMVAMCHSAGLSPMFVDMRDPAWSACYSRWPPVPSLPCYRKRSPERFAAPGIRCPRGKRGRVPHRGTYPSRRGQPRDTRLPERARPEPQATALSTALERPSSWPHDLVGTVRRPAFHSAGVADAVATPASPGANASLRAPIRWPHVGTTRASRLAQPTRPCARSRTTPGGGCLTTEAPSIGRWPMPD